MNPAASDISFARDSGSPSVPSPAPPGSDRADAMHDITDMPYIIDAIGFFSAFSVTDSRAWMSTSSHDPSGAMASLVWGVLRAPDAGWQSTEVLVALAVGVVLLAAFIGWESVAPAPMVPLSLFRSRVFSAAAGTQFLMAASIFATAYVTSEFFQVSRGDSPLGTGLRFLPWTMTPLLIAPLAGRLVDRVGARWLAAPGLAVQAVGFLWILHEAHTHAGYAAFVAPFILAGVGISMALPAPSAAGLNAAPPALLGRAAGVMNTVQQVGQAAGVAVVTVVFDAHGSLDTPAATLAGYEPALVTAATISVLGALAALGISRTRRPSSVEPAVAIAVDEPAVA